MKEVMQMFSLLRCALRSADSVSYLHVSHAFSGYFMTSDTVVFAIMWKYSQNLNNSSSLMYRLFSLFSTLCVAVSCFILHNYMSLFTQTYCLTREPKCVSLLNRRQRLRFYWSLDWRLCWYRGAVTAVWYIWLSLYNSRCLLSSLARWKIA